jgi:hypothetical protein
VNGFADPRAEKDACEDVGGPVGASANTGVGDAGCERDERGRAYRASTPNGDGESGGNGAVGGRERRGLRLVEERSAGREMSSGRPWSCYQPVQQLGTGTGQQGGKGGVACGVAGNAGAGRHERGDGKPQAASTGQRAESGQQRRRWCLRHGQVPFDEVRFPLVEPLKGSAPWPGHRTTVEFGGRDNEIIAATDSRSDAADAVAIETEAVPRVSSETCNSDG